MNTSLLFRNARVVDGTGAPSFLADLAVEDGRIAAVGTLDGATAEREIDAHGQVLAPGFIDVHSHTDLPLLVNPRNEPTLRQGVTTDLLGADGLSFAPLGAEHLRQVRQYLSALYGTGDEANPDWSSVAEFLARFDGRVASNVLYLAPHQALRLEARGWRGGLAEPDEIARMQALLRTALDEGAVGLGTGLDYFPHNQSNTDELVDLCRVVVEYGGVYVVHVRYQQIGVVAAVEETVEVAARSGVKVLISHLRNPEALPAIDRALERGLDVAFDCYPYSAGSSMFLSFLSDWVHEGGPDALLERIADPAVRERFRRALHPRLTRDLDAIVLSCMGPGDTRLEGQTLAEVMEVRGTDEADTVCDLLLESGLAAGWIAHSGTEDDLIACMSHPAHMASTDCILVGGKPHPRGWGTYPRYLARYVRELGVLTLEQCIHKMSGQPAARFGLADRGLIREGYAADLVLFDPATIADHATFADPKQYPEGISHVVVNGQVVVDEGGHTGALPGRVIGRLR